MSTSVRDAPDQSRFEIAVDGELAGSLRYFEHEGRIALDLTRIDDAFGGRGLAGQLVQGALDDLRARGVLILPLCPYVTGWLEKHPDYQDLVDRELLAQIEGSA